MATRGRKRRLTTRSTPFRRTANSTSKNSDEEDSVTNKARRRYRGVIPDSRRGVIPRSGSMERQIKYITEVTGVTVPQGLTRVQYGKIYRSNLHRAREGTDRDVTTRSTQPESERQEEVNTAVNSTPIYELGLLVQQVQRLQETVDKLASSTTQIRQPGQEGDFEPTRRGNENFTLFSPTDASLTSHASGQYHDGTPTYKEIDIVSPALQRNIWEGKDINLALLLIPDEISTASQTVVINNQDVQLRSPVDRRLQNPISIQSFIVAFGKYKDIMCQKWDRREELDLYQRHIITMYAQYQGTLFYQYHKRFSARSAAMLQQLNERVRWDVIDENIYRAVFTGRRLHTCQLCHDSSHLTEYCSLATTSSYQHSSQGVENRPTQTRGIDNLELFSTNPDKGADRYGRSIVLHQGIPLCNNFNTDRCIHISCRFKHMCSACKKPHPAYKCWYNEANQVNRPTRSEKPTEDGTARKKSKY